MLSLPHWQRLKGNTQQDTSFMVNAIRMGNGCPKDKLKNLIGGYIMATEKLIVELDARTGKLEAELGSVNEKLEGLDKQTKKE